MITTKRVTAKLTKSSSNTVTLDTKTYLGGGTFEGENRAGARTIGIAGQPGEAGPQGSPGIVWRGQYTDTTEYTQGDAVSFAGYSYIYTNPTVSVGNMPPNPSFWDTLAAGGTTGDKSYIHTQNISSDEWEITHNLGKFPTVTVVDSGGSQVEGEINYLTSNHLTISFSAEFGGKAYLN